MKFQIYALILSISCCFACGDGTKTVEETNDSGVVIERYKIDKTTKKKEGIYAAYDNEGRLIEEAVYQADSLQGVRKLYYPDGQIHYLENYENGQHQGKYQAFHKNGALALEGTYIDNLLEGEWLAYYDNGQMKERVLFKGGNENGAFTEWHANGNLKAQGAYLDGDNEHGELLLYDETGVLKRKMDCERGRCSTTWKREDQ